jgi:hypothetical protein
MLAHRTPPSTKPRAAAPAPVETPPTCGSVAAKAAASARPARPGGAGDALTALHAPIEHRGPSSRALANGVSG